MRKVLSFVLVLALVLGSFSMAFAATPTDVAGTDYSEAVTVLSGLGVVAGYADGTYKPAQAVTRAEMAKLIVVALGLEDYAVGTSKFTDMAGATWAQGYVNYAAGLGIILGYPDGTFKPSQTVSYDEAVAMIVRALGYTDASLLPATWPANYVVKAKALGVLADITAKAGGADRGDVAIMLYNALSLELGAINNDTGKWLATDPSDKMITRLGATGPTTVAITAAMVGDEDATLIDLSDYVYSDLSVYKNNDGAIIAIASVKSDSLTGEYTTAATIATSFITLADDSDVVLTDAEAATKIYLNGGQTTFGALGAAANDLSRGYDVTVYGYLNDDEDAFTTITGIVAWAPTGIYQAGSSDVTDIADAIVDGHGLAFNVDLPTVDNDDEALDLAKISVVGAATKLADIKADDVVYVYAAANASAPTSVKFEVVRNAKDITVSSKSSTKVYAGTIAYGFPTLNVDSVAYADISNFVLDDTYTVYLGNDGKILFYDKVSGTTDTYGVLVATNAAFSFGTTTTSVKILTADNDLVVYEIDDTTVFTTLSSIAAKSLVKYTLNSDGLVTMMTVGTAVASPYTYDARTNVIGGKFLASDAVVFDTSATAAADAVVSALGDGNVLTSAAKYILNDDGLIAALAFPSNTGGATSDKYFAVNEIYSVKDGTADVYQLVGFKGGVATTSLTNFTANVGLTSAPAVWTATYAGVKVSSVAAIATSTTETVDTATSTVIDFGDGDTFTLVAVNSDVLVYVEVWVDGEVDSYKVGSMSDVTYKDEVKYVTDADGITLIILTQRADVSAS